MGSSRVLTLSLSFLVVFLVACTPGGSDADAPTLRFSAIPDQNATLLRQKFGPLAEHLARELGVRCEFVAATDYKASVELFKNGDIQLAWFGGLTGVQARKAVPGARAIVQGKEDPEFITYFIAHKDTGLEPSDEFPSALGQFSFTFGSESSTSGRLMPEYYIREHSGKSPRELFGKDPGFSGDHDKTVELVQAGRVQTGVVNYTVYDRRVAEGQTDPEVCRVIWKTPPYADYNFTAHPDLEKTFGAGFTDRLQATLIAIEDKALLDAFPRTGLIKAANEDFAAIEKVAMDLGFLD